MSRSNPTESTNPCTRYHEWDGDKGEVRYYDKAQGKNIALGHNFRFILLDQLATIKGWHDSSNSGIYSNEVKDTVKDPFLVRSFKGGEIAQGYYKAIRDRIIAAGGQFTANLYILYKGEDKMLHIGAIQFKGAALNAWVEFKKVNQADIYKKGIKIVDILEGKKGKITFQTPVFDLEDISPEADQKAKEADLVLQDHLSKYFARTRVNEQAQHTAQTEEVRQEQKENLDVDHGPNLGTSNPDIDDLPF